ncbi:hypothetical protein L1276_000595 [Flavobacterium sp. HSC-32F16]|uniref:hypothetical protein n=1 Tax=Flavobacterium sp. HSC-32F16 TaxID=2910964 RepID=UPI0020A3A389|nr:hypothetical protein [Flavobacterium sp. HSC-32F16]MCP2025455.1 hypothetical protein [Flavobacterium sp. HSC-32F16]
MAMLGADISGNMLRYVKRDLISKCAVKFENFAEPYIILRSPKDLISASNHFKPVSVEVASIFIDGLIHVITKPEDMIAARTDPEPKPEEETIKSKMAKKAEDLYEKLEKIDINPFG